MTNWIRLYLSASLLMLASTLAHAYPQLNREVQVGELPLKVYRDHADPSLYWYLPTTIEPFTAYPNQASTLYRRKSVLTFLYRGQVNVTEGTLRLAASVLGTTPDHLRAAPMNSAQDFACDDFHTDDPALTLEYPNMLGNFGEIIPVSLRTTDSSLIKKLGDLIEHEGLICHLNVGFKAYVHTVVDAESPIRIRMALH